MHTFEMFRDIDSSQRAPCVANKKHRRPLFALKNRSVELAMSNFLRMVKGSLYP